MNVKYILDLAKDTLGERGKTYDKEGEERSFNQIAAVFNAVTQHRFNLKGSDVALLLLCLKLVRQETAPNFHKDSAIDATAFAAFYGECLALEEKAHKAGEPMNTLVERGKTFKEPVNIKLLAEQTQPYVPSEVTRVRTDRLKEQLDLSDGLGR